MIKSIILSIQSIHAVNIFNGFKTEELRKSVPKDLQEIIKYYGGIWVYIYVSQAKPLLINKDYISEFYELLDVKQREVNKYIENSYENDVLNGTIPARFWFDEYETYYFNGYQGDYRLISRDKERFVNATMPYDRLCLTESEVNTYGKEKMLYTWKIKQLEVFNKPMELSDFHTAKGQLKHPPQSWQYVGARRRRSFEK